MKMKSVLEESTFITEENLEPRSPVSCRDKCQEKNDEEIGVESNLGIHAQEECEKSAEDSLNTNINESDEESCPIRQTRKATIISSEEETFEDNSKSNKENIQETCNNNKNNSSKEITTKSSSFKKKSKNQIKEERLKIHSETHRLMRERAITIPYHLPKQKTLREFLSRKKNRANIPLNTPSFKMVEIWKDIEESTKTASEFFKSDSDSDYEVNKKEVKRKKHKQKSQDREHESVACDSASSRNSADEIEDNEDCSSSSEKQDNCKINNNTENSLPLPEPSTVEQSNTEKENKENDVVLDMHEENGGEVLPSELIDDETNEPHDSTKTVENSKECIDAEIPQIINEPNSDESYLEMKTLEWVKSIPAYEKLLKLNKKETLLKKINPTLLKITPKLSGESDSVIDLENVTNDIEIGAKKLKNRFLKHCLPPKQKMKDEVELTITVSESNEKGEISDIRTEKLIYHSTESFDTLKCEKPGAKLQRLREELQKKIDEKWEEEYKRQATEAQLEANNREKEEIEDEEELLEDIEDEDGSESLDDESDVIDDVDGEDDEGEDDDGDDDDEEEEEVDDLNDKPKRKTKKNMFIDNEADESGCEESGNEGGDELDEEEEENEEDEDDDDDNSDSKSDSDHISATVNESSIALKNATSVQSEEIFDKDSNSINAYDSQSSQIPPYQPGGGMLNGGSKLSQYDDDSSFPKSILSPKVKLNMYFSPDRKNTASQQSWDLDLELPEEKGNKTSFIPRFPENENFDLSEAYEFCSGKFPDNADQTQAVMVDSQVSVTSESNEFGFNTGVISSRNTFSFEYDDSKKTEEANRGEKKMMSRLKVLSDDDSEEETEMQGTNVDELDDTIGKRISSDCSDNGTEKSYILKNKKRTKHLRFSDEEGNSGSDQEKDTPDSEDESEEEEEEKKEARDDFSESEVEPFEEDSIRKVEYNSEEEEIVNPKEFFEKEAELSGSEWSGDEDERGSDEMEEEDGDKDKLDDKKVRSQLEKIHMRALLDDDARHVRILQELLFEDGDLFDDGPKRERNFRWKDLGAFFNDDGNGGDANGSHDQEELQEDEQSTKQRHEKELFLLNLKSKKEESDLDEDENERISMLKMGKVVLQRSMTSNVVREEKVVRKNINNIDIVGFKAPVELSTKRGSFLSRNEEFLSRLAKFTSNATDNILGPKHSKNFVFAAKSPEKINPSSRENPHPKRKGVSPDSGNRKRKKTKLFNEITFQEPSVLDRLV